MTEPFKDIAAKALAAVIVAAMATAVLWALTVIGWLSEAILMVMGVL